jgi:hypothetical protein
MANILCFSSSVSHACISGMGVSRKLSMRCTIGVLLVDRFLIFAGLWGATTEESVYYSACVKQVAHGTETVVEFCFGRRFLRESLEVSPLFGYERATSLGQNQNQV